MSGQLKIPARVGTEEIARALGVNRETVLRAHRRGELKSGVQIGKRVTFDGNLVTAWLQARGIDNVVCVDSEAE